jgi:hypothetical protein
MPQSSTEAQSHLGSSGTNHVTLAENDKSLSRNPHPNFEKAQAARPDWTHQSWSYSKTVKPDWKFGDGGNDGGESLKSKHIEINPYEEGRPKAYNYKLMISSIVPRPIGFLSTVGKDGNGPRGFALLKSES